MRIVSSFIIVLLFLAFTGVAKAQSPQSALKVDSIYFHLYTDSLKKGVYNYINVDAKMSNGRWRPLGSKDLLLETSYGKWDENSLIIDSAFTGEFVEVKATLKEQTNLTRSVRIYIKKLPDPPLTKSEEDLKQEWKRRKRN